MLFENTAVFVKTDLPGKTIKYKAKKKSLAKSKTVRGTLYTTYFKSIHLYASG